MPDRYDINLGKNSANFVPLTPLDFLSRAALVHPERIATVYQGEQQTYKEVYKRCRRMASALASQGIGIGATVSILAPNVPACLEAHFGVPMVGAVLNALNYRLDAGTIGKLLEHARTELVFVDVEFTELLSDALLVAGIKPSIVVIEDASVIDGKRIAGDTSYEEFIALGSEDYEWLRPKDEWQAITLNYTSGTTGNPKGVVYHHRGAYLNALSNVLAASLTSRCTYLWTLPMFHCNGWTYTWAVTSVAGTHVCIRRVEPKAVFDLIESETITHMAGAPIVLNMIANAENSLKKAFTHRIEVAVGGAPPPSQVIASMEKMGFRITHLYGLTECYGPALVSEWQDHWPELNVEDRAKKMSRQGVPTLAVSEVTVVDVSSNSVVLSDGESMGEVLIRSNTLMKGYLENPEETEKAFSDGWFHTGDLGVIHQDGYIELRDRSKDIIISGGENISSIEVEDILYKHPAILEAAVVAKLDERWGETPFAFITLKSDNDSISEEAIIDFCRGELAGFKVPKDIEFGPLPKTATGKIKKYVLREQANRKTPTNSKG